MNPRRLVGPAVLLLVLWLGIGWYYASQALAPGGLRDAQLDLTVLNDDVDAGRVVVADTRDARLAVVGLLYAGGYGRLTGAPVEVDCPDGVGDGCVQRDFTLLEGTAPERGTPVKADEYAFPPRDPSGALGLEVQTLQVPVQDGTAPAWWVPPTSSDVVAVLVHGRAGDRDEMLRIATILLADGHGILVPSYRGDGVAPDPEDGMGRFGVEEWLDVAMAMLRPEVPDDARFVMVGYSQGAALVGHLLQEADVAERVEAVVLDSPLIGLDATMQLQARLAGIPNPLVRPVLSSAYLVSRFRGFDFAEGELVDFFVEQDLPILLFHGPDDEFVPVDPSDTLSQLDPGGVTYVRIAGPDHVRFWNHDPQAYGEAVRGFLAVHLN